MWDIESHIPFRSTGKFLRDQMGRSLWCVWTRADFVLRDGAPPLFAPDQVDPAMAPHYAQDDPEGFLFRDADMSLPRPQVDLIILADGHAPGGRGDQPYEVRATWGTWSKGAKVQPAMVRGEKGRAEPMMPPPAVPLDWRASGRGDDTQPNPLGRFAQNAKDVPEGTLLPQLGARGADMERAAPALSFSAVPPAWPARARHAGTYDAAWERSRAPILPADLNPLYWQSAPQDQQLDRSEVARLCQAQHPLELAAMTPRGQFSTPIPWADFDCAVRFKRQWHAVSPELQLIHLDLRGMRLSLVWSFAFAIGAGQFDVDLETTLIALRTTRGMRVSPDQAPDFGAETREELAS